MIKSDFKHGLSSYPNFYYKGISKSQANTSISEYRGFALAIPDIWV
jgi:hypothetical protein